MNWGVALVFRRRLSSSTIFPTANQREALRRCGGLAKGLRRMEGNYVDCFFVHWVCHCCGMGLWYQGISVEVVQASSKSSRAGLKCFGETRLPRYSRIVE